MKIVFITLLQIIIALPYESVSQNCEIYIRDIDDEELSDLFEKRYNSFREKDDIKVMLYLYIEVDKEITYIYSNFFANSSNMEKHPPSYFIKTINGLLIPVYFGFEDQLALIDDLKECVDYLTKDYFFDEIIISLHTYPACWKFKRGKLVDSFRIKRGKSPIPQWIWK